MAELKRQDLISDDALVAPLQLAKNFEKVVAEIDKIIAKKGFTDVVMKASTSTSALNKETKELTQTQLELEKIQKQITIIQAKNNDEYIKQQKILEEAKKQLRDKILLDGQDAKNITAKNASLIKLDAALAKNRAEYAKLTTEEERNSAAGKKLLAIIQQQDKESKKLSASQGQYQKNVGDYAGQLEGLAGKLGDVNPRLGQAAQAAGNFGKALLGLLANPIVAIIAGIAAGLALVTKAANVFFDDTLEGQEKLNELSSYYVGLQETINEELRDIGKNIVESLTNDPIQAFEDFGKSILDNIVNRFLGVVEIAKQSGNVIAAVFGKGSLKQASKDLADAYLQVATGITDATGKMEQLADKASDKQKIAIELAKLENKLIKERMKDAVDDANTELLVNEKLEKSKNKLKFTDKERLDALREANKLLEKQLEGDIELAKQELKFVQEKVSLNGGVIAGNKLISEYTDDELKALKLNRDGIKQLADAQISLIKVQSDASAKRRTFLKQEAALQEEIDKAERDRITRAIVGERNYQKAVLEGSIKTNEQILQSGTASLKEQETALAENINRRHELLDIEKNNELDALKRAAEDRVRAEGREVTDAIIENDEGYKKERLKILQDYNNKAKDLNNAFLNDLNAIYTKQFKNAQDASKQATDQQLKILNEQFTNGDIGLREYNKRREQILNEGKDSALKIELDFLKQRFEDYKSKGFDTTEVLQQIADTEEAIVQSSADKQLAIEQRKHELIGQLRQKAFDSAIQINANLVAAENMRLDSQLESLKKNYDKQVELAGDNEALKAKLKRDFDKKEEQIQNDKKKLQRKQAIFEKAINLARAAVNTAVAITAVLEFPPLIALVAALGAAEIATIASTPIPQFAEGTDSAPGGLSIVGEKGFELMKEPGKPFTFTPDKASFMNIKRGTKIIPHEESIRLLAMASMGDDTLGTRQDASVDKELLYELKALNNNIMNNTPETVDLVKNGPVIIEVHKERNAVAKKLRAKALGKWLK
jgi:hypothetical protein